MGPDRGVGGHRQLQILKRVVFEKDLRETRELTDATNLRKANSSSHNPQYNNPEARGSAPVQETVQSSKAGGGEDQEARRRLCNTLQAAGFFL